MLELLTGSRHGVEIDGSRVLISHLRPLLALGHSRLGSTLEIEV